MRQEPKRRIETNAAAAPQRAGLNPAFAALALDLPPAATEPPPKPAAALPVWKMGRVVLRRELAKRAGKTVIVVDDFATHLPLSVIETVGRKLRQICGCGGTIRGRAIEIQGDQPAKIRAWLEGEGFEVAGVK